MNWDSPYQHEGFNKALENAGVRTAIIDTDGIKHYYNGLTTEELVAWECLTVHESPYTYYVIEDILPLDEIMWSEQDYFTPIIELNNDFRIYYTDSRRRNLKKAERSEIEYAFGPDERVLDLLTSRDVFISGLDNAFFKTLASELHANMCAEYHSVRLGEEVLAAALVLTSHNIANLRFTGITEASRALQANAFLYDRIFEHYQSNGYEIVDLSGCSHPDSNQKLLNINRFKFGYSRKIAIFRRQEHG